MKKMLVGFIIGTIYLSIARQVNQYEVLTEVKDIQDKQVFVYNNGNEYSFQCENENDFQVGEQVMVKFDDKGTDFITDDEIISIKKVDKQ